MQIFRDGRWLSRWWRVFFSDFGFIVLYVHRLRPQFGECVQDLLPDNVWAVNLPPSFLQMEQPVVGGIAVSEQSMGNLVLSQERTQELSLDGIFKDGNLDGRKFLLRIHITDFLLQ
jgi:hypothetical protein